MVNTKEFVLKTLLPKDELKQQIEVLAPHPNKTYADKRKKAALAMLPAEIQMAMGMIRYYDKDIIDLKDKLKRTYLEYDLLKKQGLLSVSMFSDTGETYQKYENLMKSLADEITEKTKSKKEVSNILDAYQALENDPKRKKLFEIARDEKQYKDPDFGEKSKVGSWQAGSGILQKAIAPTSYPYTSAEPIYSSPLKAQSAKATPIKPATTAIKPKEDENKIAITKEFEEKEKSLQRELEHYVNRANFYKKWYETYGNDTSEFLKDAREYHRMQLNYYTKLISETKAKLDNLPKEKLAALRGESKTTPMTSLPTTSLSGLSEINGKHLNLVFWLGVAAAITYFLDEDVRNIFKR